DQPAPAAVGARVIDATGGALVDELAIPHDDPAIPRAIELARNNAERAGKVGVVGIGPPDDLATREREPFVDRIPLAAILLRTPAQMRLAVQDLDGPVGRAAVDDDVLPMRIVLVLHATNGVLDVRRLVERRRDHRDQRFHRDALTLTLSRAEREPR